jgi:calcineurin-like phosphoesterase family protein
MRCRAAHLAPAAVIVLLVLAACGESKRDSSVGASRAAFVSDGPRRAANVWAVGDGADGGPGAAAVVRLLTGSRPDVLLYLGDVYPEGDSQGFTQGYARTFGALARVTEPTPGNHDWPERRHGYVPYWTRARGAAPPRYYSLRAGGWQLLSLNSEIAMGSHSPQLRWLRTHVASPGDCRLAFWHRPRFSAGTVHGDNPDVAPLWRALRGHARLVLNGHEHNMQRFQPRDGLVELIDGAGGHSLYGLRRRYRGVVFANRDTFGAIRINLRPGLARVAFVDMNGKTLDRGRVRCRAR